MKPWLLMLLFVTLLGCGAPRAVTLDITDEMTCKGQFLTNVSEECSNPEGCDQKCFESVCESYGLNYAASSFENDRCLCLCMESSKLQKFGRFYPED